MPSCNLTRFLAQRSSKNTRPLAKICTNTLTGNAKHESSEDLPKYTLVDFVYQLTLRLARAQWITGSASQVQLNRCQVEAIVPESLKLVQLLQKWLILSLKLVHHFETG